MPKSRTLALARQSDAVSLFRKGKTFDQIASDVGFSNRGTAHRVVTSAFREQITSDIEDHRAMEVARLDEVQVALWDLMLDVDVRAAATLLKVIDQRCKLLGLYDHRPANSPMLVIPQEGNTGKATSDPVDVHQERQKASLGPAARPEGHTADPRDRF